MYLELFSHLLVGKQPLGTWLLLINASRVDSHLLIRKRPLGPWILVSMYLELFSHLLIGKRPLGTWLQLINVSRVDSLLLIRKQSIGTLNFFINAFRVVFTLVYKKTTSWDLGAINQCI